MAVYYKAVLSGTYQGQNIVNVLFFSDVGGVPFSAWSATTAAQLADAIEAVIAPEYVLNLPSTYNLDLITVTAINDRGITVSDYEVSVSPGLPGGAVVNSEGQAQVAIIAYQTTTAPGAGRNVKRSYLAYGPLHDSSQSSDGTLDGTYVVGLVTLLEALLDPLGSAGPDFYPIRVGRTVDPAPTAVGRVTQVVVRPFASFRKSRKTRPTG